MNKKQIITIAIITVAVGAGMFFAGLKYEAKKLTAQFEKEKTLAPQTTGLVAPARPDTAVGEVTAKDDASFTMKAADGSSKKVMFSEATSVQKTETIKASELNVGEQVAVAGKNNDDGTLQAQNVKVKRAVK